MSIRNQLVAMVGPSLFPGIRLSDWLKLLRDNGFRVEPRYAARAASITLCSMFNSLLGSYEEVHYRERIQNTKVAPPLFILGHWRSGTTLLQNLFTLDRRFATPTLFDVLFPHVLLAGERLFRAPLSLVVPRTRFTDDMSFGLHLPHEDEFALCMTTLCSPHLSVVFPEKYDRYDRFLSLRGVAEADLDRWRAGLMTFLRKLTFKYGRPLVLKSPPHTARVRLLLEMFPEAKFLHIHRDPYEVFQSMLRTLIDSSRRQRLQRPRKQTFEERVLRWYGLMYEAFFEDRGLIREGRFHEIRFEDLQRDVVGVMQRSFDALDLPDFGAIEPQVRGYATIMARHRKSAYEPLAISIRQRVAREWRRSFDEWRYPTECAELRASKRG